MGTLRHEQHEGAADGTNITTANSTYSNTAGASNLRRATVGAMSGLSMRALNSANAYGRFDGLNSASVSVSTYVHVPVLPSGDLTFMRVTTSGSIAICALRLKSTGRIAALDSLNAEIPGTNIAAHAITAGNRYRIDLVAELAAVDNNTGRLRYRICDVTTADTNTPITTAFDSGATVDLATANADRIWFGSFNTADRGGDWYFDDCRAEDGVTTFFNGLYVASSTSTAWSFSNGAGGTTAANVTVI